jgi:hypothetical protein
MGARWVRAWVASWPIKVARQQRKRHDRQKTRAQSEHEITHFG